MEGLAGDNGSAGHRISVGSVHHPATDAPRVR
jgi:hypothetical protein